MGLSLHLTCQVLPLLLSSIQIMQIKHFTDSLSLDLTNIYTCDLSKLSHATHRHTTVLMPKYLQDRRINVRTKSIKGILVCPASLHSLLHMKEYFYLLKTPHLINGFEGIQCLLLSFITIVEKTVVVSFYDMKAAHAISEPKFLGIFF